MQFENSGQRASACSGSVDAFTSLAGAVVVTEATCVFAAIVGPVTSSAKVLVEPAINMQAVTIPNVRPMLVSLLRFTVRCLHKGYVQTVKTGTSQRTEVYVSLLVRNWRWALACCGSR